MELIRLIRLILLLFISGCELPCKTIGSDSKIYTPEEKILIKNLYHRVKGDLTQKIMHEDKYMIRYIRAHDHDLEKAESMIRQTLAWRNETNMDTIFDEDWSEWIVRYPFSLNMADYEGRPVMATHIGQINVRKHILSGKQAQMDRYLVYGYERGLYNVHEVSSKTGKEFTNGYLIFNMAGFDVRTQGCLACLQSWIRLLTNYERYYPILCKYIISVNTPRIFKRIFDVVRPLMTSTTLKSIQLYDLDKSNWSKELIRLFPENVLTREFGGTGPTVLAKPRPSPKN